MSSTSLTDFRNQFLSKVKSRLVGFDVSNSSDSDLIIQSALLKGFDAVSRFDAITPEAVSPLELMTGSELELYLGDASNRQSFELVLSSPEAMKAIASSVGAMGALSTSSKAMTALAASSTAMTALAASLNARTVLFANATAMSTLSGSSMAIAKMASGAAGLDPTSWADMVALAASATAMSALAASATALAAMNASDTAMNALYASPLITKTSYGSGATWATQTTIRTGIGLFVRLTSKAGCAGWGEGNVSNEQMTYDGTNVLYAERNANPYNHTALTSTPRLPIRRFASSLSYRGYMAIEVAFIPLTA
ncbi:MAG: hypothetical protein RIR18_1596 [Pseudomonadota bacterium]